MAAKTKSAKLSRAQLRADAKKLREETERAAGVPSTDGIPGAAPAEAGASLEEYRQWQAGSDPATPAIELNPATTAARPGEPPDAKRGPGRPRKAPPAAPPASGGVSSPAAARSAAPAPAAELPEIQLDEQQVGYLLGMVGSFNSMAVAMITKLPVAEVGKVWAFQAEELRQIAPPATKVCNKHLPDFVKRYGDEIGLLIALLPILTGKIAATLALRQSAELAQAAEREEKAAARPAQPIRPNGSGQSPEPRTVSVS